MTGALIVRSVLRKSKKQTVLIFCFMFLSAMLLNLWLMLATDYKQNYYRHVEKYNGEHELISFLLTDNSGQKEKIEAVLAADEKIEAFSISETASYYTSFPFADDSFNLFVTLYSRTDAGARQVGKLEFIEDSGESGIYLPYYYLAGKYYAVGDKFTLSMNGAERSWQVVGFFQTTSGGSAAGSKFMPYVLSDDCFDEAMEAYGQNSVRIFVRLKNADEAAEYESELLNSILSGVPGLSLQYSSYLQRMITSRYSIETISGGILGGATMIAVAVLLTVIAVCLSGCVRSNIRNFGMLKATGYVSKQLILPIVSTYAAFSTVISIIGVAVSYAVFPVLNRVLEKQVALSYTEHFLPVPAVVSVLSVVTVVVLTVFLSVIGIRSVKPLMAIRRTNINGTRSTAFRLSKTSLPLNFALSMKNTVTAVARNTVIFISMLLVSLLIGFCCFCYQYVIKDPSALFQLVLENDSDASVTVLTSDTDAFLEAIDEDNRVENSYRYDIKDITHIGGGNITVYIVDNDGINTLSYALIDGRYPQNADEIAINKYYAKRYGLSIGDTVVLSADGKQSEYIVSGLMQGARYSGRSAALLTDGIEKISHQNTVTYNVCLKDGIDVNEFIDEISGKVTVVFSTNNQKTGEMLSADYSAMLSGLSVFIIIFSLGIVIFVLYILISMLLEQKKREHGILKAIGFETRQIIFQTAFGFVPISVVAEIVGFMLARRSIGTMLSFMLNSIGIFSFNHPIAVIYLVFSASVLLVFTFAASCILSAKIKRITPHDLFNNE